MRFAVLIAAAMLAAPAARANALDDAWSLCLKHLHAPDRTGTMWDPGFDKCSTVSDRVNARTSDAERAKLDQLLNAAKP